MRLRSMVTLLGAACLLLLTGGPTSIAQSGPPQGGRSFFSLFWQQPQQPVVVPQRPRQRVAPVVVRPRASAPVIVRDDPVIPKVDVAHHIVVMGDSLGTSLGYGDLLVLTWFVASAATLGGALGTGLESDEAIRAAAYSKREEERRERLTRERS